MMAKTVAITGAARGIGRATAHVFAENGWKVLASDVDSDGLEKLKKSLGSSHQYSLLDVSLPNDVNNYFSQIASENGGSIHTLINNAGILLNEDFEHTTLQSHAKLVGVNVQGVLNCTHAAFEFLKASDHGCVINLSSASADSGIPSIASYSASKFFVRGLSEALASEWARHGIHVCAIAPHFVATEMTRNGAALFQQSPITLTARDVAELVWKANSVRSKHYWRLETLKAKLSRMTLRFLPSRTVKTLLARAAGYESDIKIKNDSDN